MHKIIKTFIILLLFLPVSLISQQDNEKIDLSPAAGIYTENSSYQGIRINSKRKDDSFIRKYFDYNSSNNYNMPLRYYTDSLTTIKKSPTGAMILSAIIPGLGQFYNQSYWKIPVIYGVAAFFTYEYKTNNDYYKIYSNKYEAVKGTDEKNAGTYKRWREIYRDSRDSYIWYFSLLYIINILDAYVDAHLFDFSVDEDYRFRQISGNYSIKFKINF
jgi:hypothetical protein